MCIRDSGWTASSDECTWSEQPGDGLTVRGRGALRLPLGAGPWTLRAELPWPPADRPLSEQQAGVRIELSGGRAISYRLTYTDSQGYSLMVLDWERTAAGGAWERLGKLTGVPLARFAEPGRSFDADHPLSIFLSYDAGSVEVGWDSSSHPVTLDPVTHGAPEALALYVGDETSPAVLDVRSLAIE